MGDSFQRAHPDLREALKAAKPTPWHDIEACRSATRAVEPPNPYPNEVQVSEKYIDSQAGNKALRLLVFSPRNASPSAGCPTLLWAHPGGFANRRAEADTVMLATLVKSGIVAVSVDYRRTPETRYPGPQDDVRAAYRWITVLDGAKEVGGAKDRVVIGGASAGANAMATLTHHLSHPKTEKEGPISLEGAPIPPLVILESPMLAWKDKTMTKDHPLGEYFNLQLQHIDILREYLLLDAPSGRGVVDSKKIGSRDASVADKDLPIDVIPLLRPDEHFKNLPPHYVSVHELDSLREQGVAYADKLRAANVSLEFHLWRGTSHAHNLLVPQSEPAEQLYAEMASQILTNTRK